MSFFDIFSVIIFFLLPQINALVYSRQHILVNVPQIKEKLFYFHSPLPLANLYNINCIAVHIEPIKNGTIESIPYAIIVKAGKIAKIIIVKIEKSFMALFLLTLA
jgi:hypothetical protein